MATLETPIAHTVFDDDISDGIANIPDVVDPRITYHGELAKSVVFVPDAAAVSIRVFGDGTVISEF